MVVSLVGFPPTAVAPDLMGNALLRDKIVALAKRGLSDPGLLSEDEVWHVCRGMLASVSALVDTVVPAVDLQLISSAGKLVK